MVNNGMVLCVACRSGNEGYLNDTDDAQIVEVLAKEGSVRAEEDAQSIAGLGDTPGEGIASSPQIQPTVQAESSVEARQRAKDTSELDDQKTVHNPTDHEKTDVMDELQTLGNMLRTLEGGLSTHMFNFGGPSWESTASMEIPTGIKFVPIETTPCLCDLVDTISPFTLTYQHTQPSVWTIKFDRKRPAIAPNLQFGTNPAAVSIVWA